MFFCEGSGVRQPLVTMVFDGCAPSIRRWNGHVPSLKSTQQTAVYHYFNHYLPEFRRLLGVRMVMDGWMATIRASEGVYVKKSTYYIVALLVKRYCGRSCFI